MVEFPLNGGSYTSQSVNADCQRTVNWYPERVEMDGRVVSYPTPGLTVFSQPSINNAIIDAAGPIGQLIAQPNGILITARNQFNTLLNLPAVGFYQISSDGGFTFLGEIYFISRRLKGN